MLSATLKRYFLLQNQKSNQNYRKVRNSCSHDDEKNGNKTGVRKNFQGRKRQKKEIKVLTPDKLALSEVEQAKP